MILFLPSLETGGGPRPPRNLYLKVDDNSSQHQVRRGFEEFTLTAIFSTSFDRKEYGAGEMDWLFMMLAMQSEDLN